MTKKELAEVLGLLAEQARANAGIQRLQGHATEEAYQRGKLDAYEIILHNLGEPKR